MNVLESMGNNRSGARASDSQAILGAMAAALVLVVTAVPLVRAEDQHSGLAAAMDRFIQHQQQELARTPGRSSSLSKPLILTCVLPDFEEVARHGFFAAPQDNAGSAGVPASAPAGESGASAPSNSHELAMKLQNPVADLISVPLQFNWDRGLGPKDADRLLLNIQPVIPISISEDWNVISRTILPVLWEDSPASGVSSKFGLGDTLQSFFFSPKKPVGGWILGVGPAIQLPTGTSNLFRTQQLALGPTGVALRQHEGWTYGILANHLWHLCGSDDVPDVNQTFLQPFLIYTFKTNTSIGVNSESTYDWNGEQWTVPLNAWVSQLVHVGKLPMQFQLGGRYYLEAPDGGPDWGVRFTVTFLFPK